MRIPLFTLILTLLLIAQVCSCLETGTIFSVRPGTGYRCVYVNLPQDLGLSYLEDRTETIIELDREESPWADMTYNKVVIEPGIINKNPICFYYSDEEEGDFSFYRISLSSPGLGVSSDITGGFCVSDYDDVDTGTEVTNETDVCRLLNDNADIIDLSFKEDVTQAKPGDVVSKTLYVTSYANLRVKLSIATNLQNDFGNPVVTTSPSRPMASKTFNLEAPEREGDFEFIIRAEAEGCEIQACKKQKKGLLSVTAKGKEGFTASVIPKNINLKEAREITFRVIISNYDEPQDFLIEASSDPELTIEPESKTVNVGKDEEKTTVFKVLPGGEDLYKMEFKITSEKSEKLLTSYLSIGELLTDSSRYVKAEERGSTPDILEEIRRAKEEYEESYNTTSYGEDISDYENFIDAVESIKGGSSTVDGGEQDGEPGGLGFDWLFLAIPVIVIVVIVLLLVAYKKSKAAGSGYQGYQRYDYPRF